MELQEVLARRRMVRAYTEDEVPSELVDLVVNAGLSAPTAGNTRAPEFHVLTGDDRREFWADVAPNPKPRGRWDGLRRAPVVIAISSDPAKYQQRYASPDKAGAHTNPDWAVTDAAFAVMSMLLAATDAGLGSCFFNVDVARPHVFGAMTLGWPQGPPQTGRPSTPTSSRVRTTW